MKIGEVFLVFGLNLDDECFRVDPQLFRLQHDGCAMGIVGADKNALMTLHTLESHPDIGLDVLEQMPKMDRAVGIGQCAGHQDVAIGHRLIAGFKGC